MVLGQGFSAQAGKHAPVCHGGDPGVGDRREREDGQGPRSFEAESELDRQGQVQDSEVVF